MKPPHDVGRSSSQAAKTLKASGVTAYSIGGADGWTLTDLFENIYLRTAGPEMYDQLTNHKIPWTDPSVKTALDDDGADLRRHVQHRRRRPRALCRPTSRPRSPRSSRPPPKAAMVLEGDFVPGVILDSTKAEPETGFNVFAFPSIDGSPATRGRRRRHDRHVQGQPRLAGVRQVPRDAGGGEIWVKRGGFSSPNKNVEPSAYRGPDLPRATATALAKAEVFRFDLSDLQRRRVRRHRRGRVCGSSSRTSSRTRAT